MPRHINIIAREIVQDWNPVHIAAAPYLQAMLRLETIDDHYGCDSGKLIINYFLANAATWRGETARKIKQELKELVK